MSRVSKIQPALLSLFLLIGLSPMVDAQIINGVDTLYGNEWIDYKKDYYQFDVSKDGIYRISRSSLESSGFPVETTPLSSIKMQALGEEVAIFTSTEGLMGENDFIEFKGSKNRSELDRHLYQDPDEELLNPLYSLFTDTLSYFISINGQGQNLRIETIENDLTGTLPNPDPFYMAEQEIVFSDFLQKPTHSGGNKIRYSSFDETEGFGSVLKTSTTVNFQPRERYDQGPNPVIDIRFAGNSVSHIQEFSVNNNIIEIFDFNDYKVIDRSIEFDKSELQNNTAFRLLGTSNSSDKHSIAFMRLNYAREYDAESSQDSFVFNVPADIFNRYIEIENFNFNGQQPILYDLANDSRMEVFYDESDNLVKILLPSSDIDRRLVLTNIRTDINSLKRINFRDFNSESGDYVIISSQKLINSAQSCVQSYADYRASMDGGSFDPIVVDVEELYRQFAFGINRHSLSIRNFIHYYKKIKSPKFIFILGKGREYVTTRLAEDLLSENGKQFAVPTWGLPGADNLLAAVKGNATPIVPIGRLAARDCQDILDYLEKVEEHENPISDEQTIEDQFWKKKIIHLSGGDPAIQQALFNYLADMASVIRNNKYGAHVTTFTKTSSDPIQTGESEAIISAINAGTSIITFFGHSAVGTFDFSLEEPGEYNNKGKYPLIISLGCHSGNIHTESEGLSESFVLEKQKAAIAFLASSGAAFIAPQYNSGRDIYNFIGDELYGKSIGEVIQRAIGIRDVTDALSIKTLNEQLTLHGDPALKLYPKEGPDYVIDYSTIKTEPTIVSTNLDSFDLSFNVLNLGANIIDNVPITILVEHILPDGTATEPHRITIEDPASLTNILHRIPVDGVKYIGKNIIKITVDSDQDVSELPLPIAENNNTIINEDGGDEFCFFILDNGARPVFPENYGIFNKDKLVLRASTNNAFLESQKYFFEIDTTELFNSPLLEQGEVTQEGGMIDWEPSISLNEGEVYYWRVSPDSASTTLGFIWEGSSFIYLPNSSEGWNHSHLYQFEDNELDNLEIQENRQLKFDTLGFFINVRNGIWDGVSVGYQFDFGNFATSVRPWNFMQEGVAIVVGDSLSGAALINSGGDFGSINTSNFGSFRCFGFNTNTPEERAAVINMLENEIEDNSFVFFWTVLRTENADFSPELWAEDELSGGQSIFSVLEDQGAEIIRELEEKGSVPYNFIYHKGNRVIDEKIAEDKFDLIVSDAFIPIRAQSGSMRSTTIGPSTGWSTLNWMDSNVEIQDSSFIKVYGISEDLADTVRLYTDIIEKTFDLNEIDPEEYPYVFLEYFAKDPEKRTAPNLEFMRVNYVAFPDAALNPNRYEVFHADTIQRGDIFKVQIAAENLSCTTDMDSLLVRFSLLSSTNELIESFERYRELPKEDTLITRFQIDTKDMIGKYQFTVEINPDMDQAEKHIFNNFGIREFVVVEDDKNPLMDVTFDGIHILDGEIVSCTPDILVELRDDNPFLPLSSIELFDLALVYPDGNIWNIPYGDESLSFTPGTESSSATLLFQPDLVLDGDYKLIVQAKDASGNFSGVNAYEVSFRIIKESSISNVLNYPNPFSTSTQFVFTLTGDVIPDNLKIQIFTVSGKVIKEITRAELGNLRIGVNRTDYRWDGTDDFGNRLANGVYLYRVVAKNLDGEDFEKFDTGTDQFFKRGMGKMVIIR